MRLIDADKLPKYDGYALSADAVAQAVENAPTIEAEPRAAAHWINKGLEPLRCSECGIMVDVYNGIPWACKSFVYCPHCGAKMDQEQEGEQWAD